jgi:hypothetical protein
MKMIIATVVLATAAASYADELVSSNGQDSVRLTDKPCSSDQVLQRLTPKFRELMRDANAVVKGVNFAACWIVDGDSAHLLYEDGDQGLIPLSDFKPYRGA